jgi:hypothetical protein
MKNWKEKIKAKTERIVVNEIGNGEKCEREKGGKK